MKRYSVFADQLRDNLVSMPAPNAPPVVVVEADTAGTPGPLPPNVSIAWTKPTPPVR